MAEILSSLTLTQLGLLLALVFLLTILVLLALLWYLRRARLARETEVGEQALADDASSSPIVLKRTASSGQLTVELGGHSYGSLEEVADAGERRRIVRSAVDLARFSGLVKIALPDEPPSTEWREELRTAAPAPVAVEESGPAEAVPEAPAVAETSAHAEPEGTAPAGPATEAPAPPAQGETPAFSEPPASWGEPIPTVDGAAPPFPEPALSEAELAMTPPQEPSGSPVGSSAPPATDDHEEETFIAQLRDAQKAPAAKRTLASLVPRPVRAEHDQSFVVQIERILQRRARDLGLDHPVHIRVSGEGALRVEWAGTLYESPTDVPDEGIRNLIRESVGEWESSGA